MDQHPQLGLLSAQTRLMLLLLLPVQILHMFDKTGCHWLVRTCPLLDPRQLHFISGCATRTGCRPQRCKSNLGCQPGQDYFKTN